jgi:hypothetical protein
MDETFWTVELKKATGMSTGVLIFTKGRIFGGDSGHTFTGNYDGDANVKGKISVHPFVPGSNFMGMRGDYELQFSGTVEGKTMTATARVKGHPENELAARLTKVADLPEERTEWSEAPPDDISL